MNETLPEVPRRIRETWDRTILVTSKELSEDYGIREWCRINDCHMRLLKDLDEVIASPCFAIVFDDQTPDDGGWFNDMWSHHLDYMVEISDGPGQNPKKTVEDWLAGFQPTLIVLGKPNCVGIPDQCNTAFINPDDADIKILLAALLDFARLNCQLTKCHLQSFQKIRL